MSSQAASISAWIAVFDWPSMVAALSVSRHGPASSSAARRKIAARSSKGSARHIGAASLAALTAARASSWVALRGDAEHVRVLVRLHHVDRVAAGHPLLAVDGHRQVDALGGELGQPPLEPVPVGAARLVVANRLVARLGNGEHGIHQGSWRSRQQWRNRTRGHRPDGRTPDAAREAEQRRDLP